jgi:hypothetical protein
VPPIIISEEANVSSPTNATNATNPSNPANLPPLPSLPAQSPSKPDDVGNRKDSRDKAKPNEFLQTVSARDPAQQGEAEREIFCFVFNYYRFCYSFFFVCRVGVNRRPLGIAGVVYIYIFLVRVVVLECSLLACWFQVIF